MVAVATKAAATMAAARARPILASRGRVLIPAMAVDMTGVHRRLARHVMICLAHHVMTCLARHVTTSRAHHATRCNARTRVAPALTWVSSAMISTNVNRPATYQQASRHLGCPRAALAVAAAAIAAMVGAVVADAAAIAAMVGAAVAVAETGAAVDHAQAVVAVAVAVAVATLAADFSADNLHKELQQSGLSTSADQVKSEKQP